MEKQQLQELSDRIVLLRNITIIFYVFSLLVIATLFFIPNILSTTLKVLCATVTGGSFVGILIALFVARRDSTIVLFFTLLSASIAWFFIGVSIGKIDGLI